MAALSDRLLYFRTPLIALLYIGIFAVAHWLAFQLRFDFALSDNYASLMWVSMPAFVGAQFLSFVFFREFSGWWRYVSLRDMLGVGRASLVGGVLMLLAAVAAGLLHTSPAFPRSIFVTAPIFTIGLIGGVRILIRLARERSVYHLLHNDDTPIQRALIVGTGPAAEAFAREVERRPDISIKIAGFIAQDPRVVGTRIQGISILGAVEDLPKVAAKASVTMVVSALEGADPDTMRRVVKLCASNDLKHRILPSTDALLQGSIAFSSLREVDLRDLLGRPPVRLANDEIAEHINTQVIMVTGAGGSIGSELCRQVARFGPAKIILVEQAENPLFFLQRELLDQFPSVKIHPIVADIYEADRLTQLMEIFKPSLVLHAAAHKHVPLMEANPSEAIKNNVIGTLNVIRAAQNAEVETCVLISTDKAVNPTSVMGASKRVAELLMQALAPQSNTRLAAVRFGNVLGSNGSVIPIFKRQIEEGGPLTVTHPEMRRYFMTIPEATQLVLQAATYAGAGDIFVLDMGEPVFIVDVARDLVRLSGLEPDVDIPITFTGMRPGEKLFEELSTATEKTSPTAHERIFRCETDARDFSTMLHAARALEEVAHTGQVPRKIREALFDLLYELDGTRPPAPRQTARTQTAAPHSQLPH